MNEQQRRVLAEQIRVVYAQTPMAAFGMPVVGLLFAWIFRDIADRTTLSIWFACVVVIAGARVPIYITFLRRKPDEQMIQAWGRLAIVLIMLQGIVWGTAWFIFIPVADPIYEVVVVSWIFAMSAASISAYLVYLRAMLAFFLPVTVPGMIHMFLIGGELNNAFGIALCIYIVVIIQTTLPINRSMVDAIRLNFDLEKEIEERKKIEQKLLEISRYDGLTELANRRHFDQVLAQEFERARRQSCAISLIMIDVDSFKAYNDTYGHLEGDTCLQKICRSIKQAAKRPGDLAARYGGEELALILPNTDSASATRIAELLRKNIQALALPHAGTEVANLKRVTVSAGVATLIPKQDSQPADLIQRADNALYQAKAEGRNRVVVA